MNVHDFAAGTAAAAATPTNRNADNADDPYCVLHGPFFFRLEIDPSFGEEEILSSSSSSEDNDDSADLKEVEDDESCENDRHRRSSPTPPRVYLAENRWNDGTLEHEGSERSDLALASARKDTFLQSSSIWNEHSLPRIDDMVKAGFVYTGTYDGTYCFSCEIMICGWSPRDDPLLKHVARSSTCKFAFRTLLTELLEKQNRLRQQLQVTIRQRFHQREEEARLDDDVTRVRARLLVPRVRDDGDDNRNGDDGYDYDVFTCERSDDFVCANEQLRRFASERDRYLTLKERVRSFRRCEWCELLPSVKSFADCGFYYVGPFDETRCVSCCRTFVNWSKHDSPWLVHAKLSPNCPYVINATASSTAAASTTKAQRMATSNDGGGCDDDDDDDDDADDDNDDDDVHKDVNCDTEDPDSEVAIVEFIDERRRVESFLEWAIKMADAGFYFTGDGDTIRCYACGGILNTLYEVMNGVNSPRDLHAFWFPYCRLSRETK